MSEETQNGKGARLGIVGVSLSLYLAAVLARVPEVITARRFWAEDGSVFFEYAWRHGALDTLLSTEIGYFMLVSNLASLVAVRLPLEAAPLAMIGSALLVQLLPALVVATSGIPGLSRGWRLPLTLGLILFVPISEECHLNTANSQFFLMIAAGLILASPAGRPGVERFRVTVLLLGGLTGLATVLLTPLFWLRAALAHRRGSDDRKLRALQAGLLSVGLIVQALAVSSAFTEGGRGVGGDVPSLLSYLGVKHAALPLLGERVANEIARDAMPKLAGGALPVPLVVATLALAAACTALAWRTGATSARWLLAAAVTTSVGSYLGAQETKLDLILPYASHRYAFGSSALLASGLLAAAGSDGRLRRLPRAALALLGAWVLGLGAIQYFEVRPPARTGPAWVGQVRAWRAAPGRELRIWPRGWGMTLEPRDAD